MDYSAGYYAYLWAEMLDDDAYQWFEDHGGLTRANGDRFRQMVLSRGNTEDLAKMYEAWRGKAPERRTDDEVPRTARVRTLGHAAADGRAAVHCTGRFARDHLFSYSRQTREPIFACPNPKDSGNPCSDFSPILYSESLDTLVDIGISRREGGDPVRYGLR